MHVADDVLCQLPCRICEFLFLKLPWCMKRVRKDKEIELCCIIHTLYEIHHQIYFLHCIVILCDCNEKGILKLRRVAVIENELLAPYRFSKS